MYSIQELNFVNIEDSVHFLNYICLAYIDTEKQNYFLN